MSDNPSTSDWAGTTPNRTWAAYNRDRSSEKKRRAAAKRRERRLASRNKGRTPKEYLPPSKRLASNLNDGSSSEDEETPCAVKPSLPPLILKEIIKNPIPKSNEYFQENDDIDFTESFQRIVSDEDEEPNNAVHGQALDDNHEASNMEVQEDEDWDFTSVEAESDSSAPSENEEADNERESLTVIDPSFEELFQDFLRSDYQCAAGAIDEVAAFLMTLRCMHNVPNIALEKIYNFFVRQVSESLRMLTELRKIPHFRTVMNRTIRQLPTVFCDYKCQTPEGQKKIVENQLTIPRDLFVNPERLIWKVAYTKFKDLKAFYQKIHRVAPENLEGPVDLKIEMSSDEVSESKVGLTTLLVISICFPNCLSPIPWYIYEYSSKVKPSLIQIWKKPLSEITQNNVTIQKLLADGKESNYLRGITATGGLYGCGFCPTKGQTKPVRKVWYPLHRNVPLKKDRALYEKVLSSACNRIFFEEGKDYELTRSTRFGIVRRSPFLDLPNFDIRLSIPVDPMHLLHHGITKATWKRMFHERKVFPDATRRKLLRDRFDHIYCKMRVISEMRHKTRSIEKGSVKASEWQCMDTLAYVAFALSFEPENKREEHLQSAMIKYCFIVRALYHSDEVLSKVRKKVNLEALVQEFLQDYSKAFDAFTFTFNLHNFIHLLECRLEYGPLSEISTGRYESMYAKLRRCYKPNTPNVPKQALLNFNAHHLQSHKCHRPGKYILKTRASGKSDDTCVYKDGKFYQIVGQDNSRTDRSLRAIRIKTRRLKSVCSKLPFRTVGVERVTPEIGEKVTFMESEITAKAVVAANVISTIEPHWMIT